MDATFNLSVVPAVTVDGVVIPDGNPGVETNVNLTASGGETPFRWSVISAGVGLQASVLGNTLSLSAPTAGTFDFQVAVNDSLGGSDSKAFTYRASEPGLPTSTPTACPSATPTATACPSSPTGTSTPTPPVTPTSPPPVCVGDCNGDRQVLINELLTGVNIVLETMPVSACPAFRNSRGTVDVAQVIRAVNSALFGCPA